MSTVPQPSRMGLGDLLTGPARPKDPVMDEATIEALKAEHAGYARRGLKDRAAQVAATLKAAGVEVEGAPEAAVEAPAETATKPRPRKRTRKAAKADD